MGKRFRFKILGLKQRPKIQGVIMAQQIKCI